VLDKELDLLGLGGGGRHKMGSGVSNGEDLERKMSSTIISMAKNKQTILNHETWHRHG
jgi:hypothetical protein